MKILAVGMNYAAHNKELNETLVLPEKPVIFSKPETALLKDNKPFFLPDFGSSIDYETEIVVRISRMGKNIAPRFADRYYDALTVGIDFTARDMQRQLRSESLPWDLCKGFDNSAVVGQFVPVAELGKDVQSLDFGLDVDGVRVQTGNTSDMIFPINELIAYISQFITLKVGDLIYTGTPVGVGPISIGQHLEGYLEGKKLFDFHVK